MYCLDGNNFIRCGLKEGDNMVLEIIKTDSCRCSVFLSIYSDNKKLFIENDTEIHKQFLGIFTDKTKLNEYLNNYFKNMTNILGLSLEIGPKFTDSSLNVIKITNNLRLTDSDKPNKYLAFV